MSEILLYYRRPDPITWVYLSSFLTIGIYFVFHRFWSIRNLDIALLILLAPGLLMVHEGNRRQLAQDTLQADEIAPDTVGLNPGLPDAINAPESAGSSSLGTEPDSAAQPLAISGLISDTAASDPGVDGSAPESEGEPELLADAEAEPQKPISARSIQRRGFVWLFLVELFLLVRMLLDPLMVRRPLLDPNLTTGGLNFIGISLFIFIMANVVASTPRIQEVQGPKLGPGYALMNMLPAIPTRPESDTLVGAQPPTVSQLDAAERWDATIAKFVAILAHIAIVTGIVLIGKKHFNNLRAGTGCAFLYLLLPYTAQMTGRVDHAVPAALLLWALLTYRKPMIAGIFMGLAAGLVYYPLFLLPLWFSFYWQRGARRFGVGVVSMLTLLMVLLAVSGTETLVEHLRQMFGLASPTLEPKGIWELGWNPIWRLPVIVAFVILSFFFAAWPTQKNLGTLLNCSAALMIAAQFWHGYGGGLYIAWFLPLALLTIFRPNLQDRVAVKVIDASNGSTPSRRPEVDAV